MTITWSMKRKDDKEWRLLRRHEIPGETIRGVLEASFGTEAVAEIKLPATGSTWYFCGTDRIADHMKTKGKKAVTCDAGIRLIDSAYPGMLDNAKSVYQGPEGDQQLILTGQHPAGNTE